MIRGTILSTLAAAPILATGPARAAHGVVETDDGQRLFFREAGAGTPVVFIHGWTLSSEIWSAQLDWLAARGLRALAYDRRGHGQSSRPVAGYDSDRLTADLATFLDRLDLKDVTLMAHSMGGGEAVRYLAQHGRTRIARLLLVAPTAPYALKTPDNPDGVDKAIYDKMAEALVVDRIAYMQAGLAAFLGPAPDPALVDRAMTIALQAAPQAQLQCLRSFTETDFRGDLGAVTVPTLIQYGTADSPITPVNARRTHQGIAGSRLEIYEGAPHALFMTDLERFNRDLLHFTRS